MYIKFSAQQGIPVQKCSLIYLVADANTPFIISPQDSRLFCIV